jgi:hypothetical protein
MIALADRRAWFDLQNQVIERVHVSWLPQIAPELCLCARRTVTGRRWLANELSGSRSPLFGLPAESGPGCAHDLHRSQWLAVLLRDPLECALDLGSLALATTVRTVVTRPLVSRLRAVLGGERYERALRAPGLDATEEVSDTSGDIIDSLTRRGAHELAAYSASVHPALGESVKFCFECNWWDCITTPLLSTAVAESCLRPQGCTDRAEVER